MERDAAEGGRRRGRLCERAPEQGAAEADAIRSSSGSGTWRNSRQWYMEERMRRVQMDEGSLDGSSGGRSKNGSGMHRAKIARGVQGGG
ncbi:hypothetical protein Syun_023094 [Stephania yunnanensis]|uniref:Uncharacterized protein n=1 Tax=Stephania yunnanensis TaxID=152371 RepID=A0AAP0HZ84_9MAGN